MLPTISSALQQANAVQLTDPLDDTGARRPHGSEPIKKLGKMALEQARPLAERFIHFVNKTGSPYHSVQAIKEILTAAGFEELQERTSWKMTRGGKYLVTRNDSCIAAIVVGENFTKESHGGFCVTATHSDSPCLRLRPRAFAEKEGYHMGSVECYGGGLWHTWLDRGLGMAGKVVLRKENKVIERLLRFERPLFYVPNLAIHLQTAEEIGAFKINKENHLQPVLCSAIADQLGTASSNSDDSPKTAEQRLPPALARLVGKTLGMPDAALLDWDFCLMDATPSRISGIYEEFIESPRLDNLASTFAAFEALVDASSGKECDQQCAGREDILMAVAFDHEEIGSQSLSGANSSLLETWMQRCLRALDCESDFFEILAKSFLGVVIKENANQNYASNASTMAFVRLIANEANVPVQDFVVRNDSRCGGTVGAMLSARLGVRTVDIGIPQWAMHSCREICGVTDLMYLQKLLKHPRREAAPAAKVAML
ncbi:putative aspartyl aminopeptidase [Cyclospora cayetanensis]|uniref:aspartyl aminopeptidase n=1 Tax=Cyclospora cayetanensis TaxID=88456 RepID=A0A1D3D9T0_9EIME|nr:putative aspartyl aminopeptidase [Cyclospora cayetanensis]